MTDRRSSLSFIQKLHWVGGAREKLWKLQKGTVFFCKFLPKSTKRPASYVFFLSRPGHKSTSMFLSVARLENQGSSCQVLSKTRNFSANRACSGTVAVCRQMLSLIQDSELNDWRHLSCCWFLHHLPRSSRPARHAEQTVNLWTNSVRIHPSRWEHGGHDAGEVSDPWCRDTAATQLLVLTAFQLVTKIGDGCIFV